MSSEKTMIKRKAIFLSSNFYLNILSSKLLPMFLDKKKKLFLYFWLFLRVIPAGKEVEIFYSKFNKLWIFQNLLSIKLNKKEM